MIEAVRTLGFAGSMLVVGWTFGRRDWHVAAGFVAIAAVVICILAFASRLLPSLLPSAVEEAGIDTRRLSYPLNYWNAVGVWAAMTDVDGARLERACGALVDSRARARSRLHRRPGRLHDVLAHGGHRHGRRRADRRRAFRQPVACRSSTSLVAAVGSAVVIYVIRAHPDIADYTGTGRGRARSLS